MRPILEPCEHPQCEQNASPYLEIGLPQELQGPRRITTEHKVEDRIQSDWV